MDKPDNNHSKKSELKADKNIITNTPANLQNPENKPEVGRSASVKRCLKDICKRQDVSRDSYDELMEGEGGMCKGGVKKCTAVWWKIFLLMGVVLLLTGIVCVSYGYLFSPRTNANFKSTFNGRMVVGPQYTDFEEHKQDLEIVKLVGLILFCVGGLTVAVALMIPSFLYRYFEVDEDSRDHQDMLNNINNNVNNTNNTNNNESTSLIDATKKPKPSQASIPLDQSLSQVQPSPLQSAGRPNKAFH